MEETPREVELQTRTDTPARVFLDEGNRQLILLAVAELALSRPGFDDTLGRLSELFYGREMFEGFKRSNADRVKASHGPFGFAPEGSSPLILKLEEWVAHSKSIHSIHVSIPVDAADEVIAALRRKTVKSGA